MRAVRRTSALLLGLCALVVLSLTATIFAQPVIKNPDTLVIVRINSPDESGPGVG